MDLRLDLLAHLAVAAVLGGVVGWEREARGKPAGLRTNLLICVGAALFTDLSLRVGVSLGANPPPDPTRIAAQIVSGIGFLGAGTIIQARGAVHGLTTAATLWVVSAIGMAAGSGSYVAAVGTTALVLAILFPLGRFERWVEHRRRTRTVVVRVERDSELASELVALLREEGLDVRGKSLELENGLLTLSAEVMGPEAAFDAVRSALLSREDVRGLRLR